jgi:hypothetical protein
MTDSDPLDAHPTDQPNQLPAIISPGVLTSPMDAYAATLVPALIAAVGSLKEAIAWQWSHVRHDRTARWKSSVPGG